eukprot:681281_1
MVACIMCIRFWRSRLLLLMLCLWIIYQFTVIYHHASTIPNANPYTFAQRFNFIRVSRTNMHSKTLQYWIDWFKLKTIQQVGNVTFTLLHFDYHPNYDTTHDPIYPCSPSQLIYYHQLVEETLDSLNEILYPINRNKDPIANITNMTQYVHQYGYIDTIVWIYPDHWVNYTQSFVYGLNYHRFRALISNRTYYVTPMGNNHYEYTFDAHGLKHDEIELLQTKVFAKTITPRLHNDTYNSATSIRFRIYAIALSELQSLVTGANELFTRNKVILDLDLDFFVCQSPSETLKDYFHWNDHGIGDILNTFLSHHQYAPSHIHNEDLHYAMLVLLHQLSHNQSESKSHGTGLRSDDDFVDQFDESSGFKNKDKMKEDLPSIADLLQHATEYHLHPLELRDLLYHLYRFHLEIGDVEFVQPMRDYIQTHQHLDRYLLTMSNQTSHVVDHHALHQEIANSLNVHLEDSDTILNVSVDQFGEMRDVNDYQYYNQMNTWIHNHQSMHLETEGEYEMDEEEFISAMLQKLKSKGNIYQLTPSLLSEILRNVTKQQNYNVSYWTDMVSNSNAMQNLSIWAPEHVKFIHSLEKQYNVEATDINPITYPQSLERLQVSGDYLYSDWENILKYHSTRSNDSWINKYMDGDWNDEWNGTNTEVTAHNLSTIIPWDSLDPMQQHFIRKANHSLLEKFLASVTPHQKKFLDWLIFCHLHGHVCEDGHSPIDLLDQDHEDRLRLKGVDWDDMNELPALVASEKHNDMLQFKTVFHGFEHDHHHNETEQRHIPTLDSIKNSIETIVEILVHSKVSLMAIGIEMSYGHVPKNIHEWLDCYLSISLYNALQTQSQFVTFYASQGDAKVLRYKCMEELVCTVDTF